MKKSRVAAVLTVVVVVLVALAMLMHVPPFSGNGSPTPTPSTPPGTGTNPSTTTPGYVRLSSLNGTLHCLDGEEITRELWSRMRDYDASDPSVKPYIDWLRKALAPNPGDALNVPWYPSYRYYWFNDRHGWSMPLPDEHGIVRIGLVKLPFGAGLVVTAYPSKDGIITVIHGTIINSTEWRELLARTATYTGYYFVPGALFGGALYYDEYTGVLDAETMLRDAETIVHNNTVEWVLWRISLRPRATHLVVGEGSESIPVKSVVVLLEMPAYTSKELDDMYWWQAEAMYWDIVGHPALSLAIHLASLPDTDPVRLYTEMAYKLTWNVVLTGVKHPGDVFEEAFSTPFLIRKSGRGVCNEQSRSTSMFASNALGAYTGYLIVPAPSGEGHSISVLLYPASPAIDVDGDGEKEAVVIVDTAHLGNTYINSVIGKGWFVILLNPPLVYVDEERIRSSICSNCGFHKKDHPTVKIIYKAIRDTMYGFVYTGVPEAVLSLPKWLKAPWLNYTISKSNFTSYEEKAWSDTRSYALLTATLPIIRDEVNTVLNGSVYMVPPSMALALGKVINNLPLVYEAETPSLPPLYMDTMEVRNGHGAKNIGGVNITVEADVEMVIEETVLMHVEAYANNTLVFNDTVKIEYTFGGQKGGWIYFKHGDTYYLVKIKLASSEGNGSTGGSENSSSGGRDNNTGNETPTQPSQSINTTIRLTPIYTTEETPWGEMPVLDRLTGTSVVDNTNITVEAFYSGGSNYNVYVYVNSSYAYGTYTGLPTTLEFSHNNTEYEVRLELPEPPVLNETIELELVPVDHVPVQLPNGTVINVTVYMVNQTITVGNVSIVVFGYVSRLGVDLDVWIFGVPPANYSVSVEGIDASIETDYSSALHTYIHYEAPENQLIPQGVAVKIMIQPLDLILTILLNG